MKPKEIDKPQRIVTCHGCGQSVYLLRGHDKAICGVCGGLVERIEPKRRLRGVAV